MLGKIEGEDGVVLGLATDVDNRSSPVYEFGTPKPGICHIANGLTLRDLLGLRLTFVVGEDDDAPGIFEDGLDEVAEEVGSHLLLG